MAHSIPVTGTVNITVPIYYKVGDRSRGRAESFLFNNYLNEV